MDKDYGRVKAYADAGRSLTPTGRDKISHRSKGGTPPQGRNLRQ